MADMALDLYMTALSEGIKPNVGICDSITGAFIANGFASNLKSFANVGITDCHVMFSSSLSMYVCSEEVYQSASALHIAMIYRFLLVTVIIGHF